MSRSVELSDEQFARMEEAAAEGLNPADSISERPDGQPCSNGEPPQSLADLFVGHIGRFNSGHGKPRIEDLRESYGEYLEAKHRAGHL